MRTHLTLALAACAVLIASPGAFAQPEKKSGIASQDRKYFRDIARANMAEVEAGKLAQKKAKSEEVKSFASHMVEDHGKMIQEQQTMAKSKAVSMPKSPRKANQAELKKLESTAADRFDGVYMQQMVKDHAKALKLVQETAKNAKDPDLKAAAEKAAPEVQKHLEMARQIAAKSAK